MDTNITADTVAFLWRVVSWCDTAMLVTVIGLTLAALLAVWAWWRSE